MKKLVCLFILFLFLVPTTTFAHLLGQPPYFKINDVFTDYYPVPSTSLDNFELPQDIAQGNFLVNEEISFEIDTKALPLPEEILSKTKFLWDFKDGTRSEGLRNTHIFTAPGTYIIDVKVDSGDGFEPQLLQSTAINILPDKDYVLPKAVIEVNGKVPADPLLDLIDVNFKREIKLNAGKTEAGSSEVISYEWDLGDGHRAEGKNIIYQYPDNPYTVFPVLRVRTKDGFISDAFVQIKDENSFGSSSPFSAERMNWEFIAGAVIVSAILALLMTLVISKFILKKK